MGKVIKSFLVTLTELDTRRFWLDSRLIRKLMFIPYFILISICLLRKNQASDPYLEINLPDTEIQQFVDDLWNEEKDQWPSLRVNFQRHTTASNQRDEAPERLKGHF